MIKENCLIICLRRLHNALLRIKLHQFPFVILLFNSANAPLETRPCLLNVYCHIHQY